MLEKAWPYLTQMRFFFVVLFLKILQKLSLEFVNILNISKNGAQLGCGEHSCMFATLPNVTLETTKTSSVWRYNNSFYPESIPFNWQKSNDRRACEWFPSHTDTTGQGDCRFMPKLILPMQHATTAPAAVLFCNPLCHNSSSLQEQTLKQLIYRQFLPRLKYWFLRQLV